MQRRRCRRPVAGDGADDLHRDRDHDGPRDDGPEPRTHPGDDVARAPPASAQAERCERATRPANVENGREQQSELLRRRDEDGSAVRIPTQEPEDEVVREQHQPERHQGDREELVEAPHGERPPVLAVRPRRDGRGDRPHRRARERLDAHQPISTRRFRRSSAFSMTRRAPSVLMKPGTRGPSSTARR